jgi:hypothetical protein
MHVAKPQEPKQEDQRKEETMTKKSFFDSLSWQQDQGQGQKQPVKSFADQESESCLLSGSEDEDDFATLTSLVDWLFCATSISLFQIYLCKIENFNI